MYAGCQHLFAKEFDLQCRQSLCVGWIWVHSQALRVGVAHGCAHVAGHGICDNLSRSVTLPRFTDSAKDLGREGRSLLRAVGIPARDIRGVGLTVRRARAGRYLSVEI